MFWMARILIVSWMLLGACCARTHADGGSVVLSEKKGGFQITAFASPTPMRAGPVDVSVLVQDVDTGEVVPQARVEVSLSNGGPASLASVASHEAATNKLLQAVQFSLPQPGRWRLAITVEDKQKKCTVERSFDAAEALPPWRELWPWVMWPVFAVAVFGLHRYLVQQRASITASHLSGHAVSHPSVPQISPPYASRDLPK